jgi:NAD(P)-dependent dehydrogenase (short-subunit alcohol dehydrogenase family)
MPDRPLDGQTALVTGATSGIGAETAKGLARAGARVVLVGRDPARCAAAVAAIRGECGDGSADSLVADLAAPDAVRRLADDFRARHDRLHVLVHNAGAMFLDHEVTPGGVERTFALNHLAPFLLTDLLLEPLRAAAPARVVVVASDAHRAADLDLDDWPRPRRFRGFPAYCRSKLANVLFARELARRLAGTGVTANSLHPGFVASRFFAHQAGPLGWSMRRLAGLFAISPERGAQTSLHLATSPEVAGVTGRYFARSREATPSKHAQDDDAARRLWDLSAALVGAAGPPG